MVSFDISCQARIRCGYAVGVAVNLDPKDDVVVLEVVGIDRRDEGGIIQRRDPVDSHAAPDGPPQGDACWDVPVEEPPETGIYAGEHLALPAIVARDDRDIWVAAQPGIPGVELAAQVFAGKLSQ